MGERHCSLDELNARIERHGASAENAENALSCCFSDIVECFKPGRAFMQLYDEQKDDFFIIAGHNVDTSHVIESEQLSLTILNTVIKNEEPVLTADAMEDIRFSNKSSVVISGLRSVLCSPILSDEGLLGIFYMDNNFYKGVFKKEDMASLEAACRKLAMVVKKVRPDIKPRERD
ncbi:MAG: GAF domain-containing protein [Candidatus Eremiobacteraeota bacterium]|nr:GAF domain-containing protein [Candidatus Eremiobacteraeota bacterium]